MIWKEFYERNLRERSNKGADWMRERERVIILEDSRGFGEKFDENLVESQKKSSLVERFWVKMGEEGRIFWV